MRAHFINSPSHHLTPDPSPKGEGSSLAVLQWVELLRGERPVMKETNPYRVEAVRAEEHYCLSCLGLRWFDVIYAVTDVPVVARLRVVEGNFKVKQCRYCGKVGVECRD